jgi:2'-5' RNA ligase
MAAAKTTKKPARTAEPQAVIRAFAALDLDGMSLRRVMRVSDRLRMSSGAPSATWTPAGNIHVTLKFMGALPLDAVAPLSKAIGALVTGKTAPAPCPLKLTAFPDAKDARIVVVELLDGKGTIAKLAAKVEALAGKLGGVPEDERDYRPHVTLARLKLGYDGRRWLRADLAEAAGECRAAGVTLYRSDHLGGEVPVYVPLARFAFAVT